MAKKNGRNDGFKNSELLMEAAQMVAEYAEEEVCAMLADEFDGVNYCPSGCPRVVDDGCVLHLLRMRCAGKRKG